ncbi:hypothetical protein SERLADRAFT_402963, partial [Serpula lacrymans var. lacrymans S7.9]
SNKTNKHRYLRFHANPVELFLDAGLVCSGVNSGSSKEARTYRLSGNFERVHTLKKQHFDEN